MKEVTKKSNVQSKENRWVDVHDDNLMVKLGLRNPDLEPIDRNIYIKTSNERRLLKELRHSYKGDGHFHDKPDSYIPIKSKLVIQLKKNKKFPKTTYSMECYQNELPTILSKYMITVNGSDRSIIAKYNYNGRTYAPDELPFWK